MTGMVIFHSAMDTSLLYVLSTIHNRKQRSMTCVSASSLHSRLCGLRVWLAAGCTSGVVLQSLVYSLSILGRQFWASASLLSHSSLSATMFWISVVCWGLCGASEVGSSAASAVLWPAVATLEKSEPRKKELSSVK